MSLLAERSKILRPQNGRQYELFDCSVFLLVLLFIGYVITIPSPAQQMALGPLFALLPQQVWGAASSIAALYAIYASYSERLVTSGYYVGIITAGVWSTIFIVGFAERVPNLFEQKAGALIVAWALAVILASVFAVYCPHCAKVTGNVLAAGTAIGIVVAATTYTVGDERAVEGLRLLISAVLYGWIARRLWREEDREYHEPARN